MWFLSNVGISKQLNRRVRRPPHGSGPPKGRRVVPEWAEARLRRCAALRRLPGDNDPPKSIDRLLCEVIVALDYFEALPTKGCFDLV